ncbi:MAG: hypothetical protein E7L40_08260 [Corynebacterium kroppenstedtii]|nr:hypothetical protein [Corynebacterium kroppenstedtii]
MQRISGALNSHALSSSALCQKAKLAGDPTTPPTERQAAYSAHTKHPHIIPSTPTMTGDYRQQVHHPAGTRPS